ncbi:MAG: PAS domain-containing protein [Rickettsiales bacterium]|nr:PAS domain-containing protein [Rickettsiales bacterium]
MVSESDKDGYERRITRRLVSYWKEIYNTKGVFPKESDIDADDLEDIWDNCFLLNIKINPENKQIKGVYSYLGASLLEAYGCNFTGEDFYSSMISANNPDVAHKFMLSINAREPVIAEGSFVNGAGMEILYRQCFLPLCNDSGIVTHVFGGMKWMVK